MTVVIFHANTIVNNTQINISSSSYIYKKHTSSFYVCVFIEIISLYSVAFKFGWFYGISTYDVLFNVKIRLFESNHLLSTN